VPWSEIHWDGEFVGETVGESVGEPVGESVGEPVGELVGESMGESVGESVGGLVGESVGFESSWPEEEFSESGIATAMTIVHNTTTEMTEIIIGIL